jgi:hypothetical protein
MCDYSIASLDMTYDLRVFRRRCDAFCSMFHLTEQFSRLVLYRYSTFNLNCTPNDL